MAKIKNLVSYVDSQGEAEKLVEGYAFIGRSARWDVDKETGRIKVTVFALPPRKRRSKDLPTYNGAV